MHDDTKHRATDAIAMLSPAGYHVAIRVGFAFPEYEENAYPAAWTQTYTRNGYMLDDPIMRWIYANSGMIRWSDLVANDRRGVLMDAAQHGLHYGVAVSCVHETEQGLRSFGSFARADREFTDQEMILLERHLIKVEADVRPKNLLTKAEQEAFRLLGEGRMLKEIAFELGISESAVKQRLTNGRGKLSARTNMQAVMDATRLGWLD